MTLDNSKTISKPRIFEGIWQGEPLSNFNGVTICLDGRLHADLDWKEAKERALYATEKNYDLMWDINLGLFNDLRWPLANQMQFASLALSLEHFRDSLWLEFKSHTIGFSLYRGHADFSIDFPWDFEQEQNLIEWLHERKIDPLDFGISIFSLSSLQHNAEGKRLISLFCRDVAIEYLTLLISRLPDDLSPFLFLDASSFSGYFELQLLNPERFNRLHLALKGHSFPFCALGWHEPTAQGYSGFLPIILPLKQPVLVGICIPSMTCYEARPFIELEKAIQILRMKDFHFRFISENLLTSQWDELNFLFYSPSGLSAQGKRKLQGFCAAGGIVVTTGSKLGLAHELDLSQFAQRSLLDG